MTEPIPRPEGPVILLVELLLAFLLAVYLLHKYANLRHQNPFVTVSTLIVWFLSFVIIFLLPVDVSSVSETRPRYIVATNETAGYYVCIEK